MKMLFRRKQEVRADTPEAELLSALMGGDEITREKALGLPSIAGCVNLIGSTVSSLPIKMYRKTENGTEEILDDNRLRLLNGDTKDTLSGTQFWKAMLEDYYFGRNGGFAYINKRGTKFRSLNYVENVSIMKSNDKIFKSYDVMVDGVKYYEHNFLKILRKTKDGCTNISILDENKLFLATVYNSLYLENKLVKKGGAKKGFLKSEKQLSKEAMDLLKEKWAGLFSASDENALVLNGNIDFVDISQSSKDMQVNESKQSNSIEASMIFGISNSMLRGNASDNDRKNFATICIAPLLCDIETSLDRDMLTEKEKQEGYYFAFDTRELSRGNLKERYEAYQIGIKSHFIQPEEVRAIEDLPKLGIDFIELGLDTVMYNPTTKEVYTPNTNQTVNLGNLEKGGTDEGRS